MATELVLYNDIVQRRIVPGLNSLDASIALDEFSQGDQLKLQIWPVVPTYRGLAAFYSKALIGNLDLRVGIGPRIGAEARLAAQDIWTAVVDGEGYGYFSATLDLNTSQMNTAIAAAEATGQDFITSNFVILTLETGVPRVTYDRPVKIKSRVIDYGAAVTLPSPVSSYYEKTQIDAMFASYVKWVNDAVGDRGRAIITLSLDGTRQRQFGGVDDDGAATDYII